MDRRAGCDSAIALAQESQSAPNPPDEPSQKKLIEDTIAKARAYEKDLPDYVCSQVTIRNDDPKGTNQWKMLGSTNEELTYPAWQGGVPAAGGERKEGRVWSRGETAPNRC